MSRHAVDDLKPFGVRWHERKDTFWDRETGSFLILSLVAMEVAAGVRERPTRHVLNYNSDLMMIDGELTHRCHGCGEWEAGDHPPPPLCVFQISDFLGPEDR